jgi:menaquinone-9 beta-reductase
VRGAKERQSAKAGVSSIEVIAHQEPVCAGVSCGPQDFTNYEQTVKAAWAREYRRGRFFHKLVGIPALAGAGLKVLDSVNHPGFRAHLLFWEGTLSGR